MYTCNEFFAIEKKSLSIILRIYYVLSVLSPRQADPVLWVYFPYELVSSFQLLLLWLRHIEFYGEEQFFDS